jgi:hypothetical protein
LLRKLVAAIILVPLAVVIIAFAVANRHSVTVSFDPFSSNEPAASVTLPLFALVILMLRAVSSANWVASAIRSPRRRARRVSPRTCRQPTMPRRACGCAHLPGDHLVLAQDKTCAGM